jgi:hypothetical protein
MRVVSLLDSMKSSYYMFIVASWNSPHFQDPQKISYFTLKMTIIVSYFTLKRPCAVGKISRPCAVVEGKRGQLESDPENSGRKKRPPGERKN